MPRGILLEMSFALVCALLGVKLLRLRHGLLVDDSVLLVVLIR
jgi:hypothetical protein